MADSAVYIELASNNGDFFTNALLDDVMIRPQYATQKVLIGTSNGNLPTVTITSNTLGILTTTPAYPLDVSGDINLTGTLRQNGAPYIGSQWSNNSSNVFLLTSNVGIGKSNPAFKLDVSGDINFTGTLNQNGVPYIGSQWSNNSTSVFLLSSNVGIGKSNPAYPLDVTGDINFTGIFRQNGVPYIGSQWSNNSSNIFVFGSNIGINTSNAVEELTVIGGKIYSDTQLLGNSNDSITAPSFSFREDSNTGLYHPCNDTLGFVAGGVEALRVTPGDLRVNQTLYCGSNLNVASNIIANGNLTMNNRLLIGKLTVNRKIGGDANVTKTSILGFSNAADGIILDLGSNTPQSNQALRVTWSNSSELMRVTGDGNVGVGTTTPAYKLDVSGSINTTGMVLVVGGSNCVQVGGNNPGDMIVKNYGSSDRYGLGQYTGGITRLFTSGSFTSSVRVSAASNDVRNGGALFTDYVTVLGGTTTNAGFVGIGTTTPSEKLDIVGNVKASSNVYVTSRLGVGTSNPSVPVHVVGDVRVEGNLNVNGIYNTINTDVQLTDQFTVSNNGTGPALKVHQMGAQPIADFYDDSNLSMRIADGGNVGIGPSNPVYKLDVFGTTKIGQKNTFHGASTYRNLVLTPQTGENRCEISFEPLAEATGSNTVRGYVYKDTTGFTLGTATGGNTLFVGSNNRVGVGTTSPSFLLDVNGTSRATLCITGNGTTTSLNGAPTTSGLILTSSTYSSMAAPHISVYLSNATYPVYQQLNYNYDSISQYFDSYYDGTNARASSNSAPFQIQKQSSKLQLNYAYPTTTGSTVSFYTGLAMTSNGNVGIGTNAPGYKLDVVGSINTTGMVLVTGGSNCVQVGGGNNPGDMIVKNYGTSDRYGMGQYTGGVTRLFTSGSFTSSIRISAASNDARDGGALFTDYVTVLGGTTTNAGFVGIGTNSPAFKLDVNGDVRVGNNNALITGSTTGYLRLLAVSSACYVQSGTNSNNNSAAPLIFGTINNATEWARFDSSGNLAIGTTSASYKLHVNGTIYATGDVICYSDKRLKSNITLIDSALTKLHKLNGYTFNLPDDDKTHTGLIAQELLEVLPEAVYKEKKEDGDGYYSVAYGNMAGLFVEAIKELDNKYKKENEALREELAELKQLIAAMHM